MDDALFPAETKDALQRMLDIVARWTYQWRTRIRLGPDQTAFMVTGRLDPARQGNVHITIDGQRQALPAVSCYTYFGLPLQCNLLLTRLAKYIARITNQRTWAVVRYAARHRLHVTATEALWRSQAYNAFKHLLVFCPLEQQAMAKLSAAQES